MPHPSMLTRCHISAEDALKLESFLFLRHGRTEHNLKRIIQGHRDIPLDAVGREEAAQAAGAVRALGWVDHVASSDLARAKDTAEALASRHGLTVALDADLRERSFGPYEGEPAGPDLLGIASRRRGGFRRLRSARRPRASPPCARAQYRCRRAWRGASCDRLDARHAAPGPCVPQCRTPALHAEGRDMERCRYPHRIDDRRTRRRLNQPTPHQVRKQP